MGFTFTEIERKKGLRIFLLFGVLLLIWLSITFVVALFIFFRYDMTFTLNRLFAMTVFAFILSVFHFLISSSKAVQQTVKLLRAIPPDMDDEIHRTFKNVIDEMNIATGNAKNIDGFVAPSLSLNALAVSNLRGGSAIILTEGLLSRLKREELEAVIAHEAYHIVSGDCTEASAAISLFSLYSGIPERLSKESEFNEICAYINPFVWYVVLMDFLGRVVGMFISREREYRADAASARITRNPMALASALYKIGRGWSGSGFIGSGIEMLCISSPAGNDTKAKEGFFEKLLSTHPPIDERIGIMLMMAHKNLIHLRRITDEVKQVDADSPDEKGYYALDNTGQWQGPLGIVELSTAMWIGPDTMFSLTGGDQTPFKAIENPDIAGMLLNRIDLSDRTLTDIDCPKCKRPLYEVDYEGTRIYECAFCRGALVRHDRLPRIIARRGKKFTPYLKNLARAVHSDTFKIQSIKRHQKKAEWRKPTLLNCPKCSRPMMRTFFSLAYLIEIDRCSMCRIDWFDADELEMLQYLIETKAASKVI